MRRSIVFMAALVLLALSAPAPSQAAVNSPIALPGAGLTGFATPVVVLDQSAPANFVNLDPVEPHDFVSVRRVSPTGPRLFSTSQESGPGLQAITFARTLEPGEYDFVCLVHQGTMTGTATVL